MKLSIVSTLYRSVPFIEQFHERISRAAREWTEDYEIIFVNDGSPDASLEMALKLAKSDPHLTIVELSRNFGHHAAIVAGLEQAKGEYVFLMDCDLEEQPEWLPQFREAMERTGADVVYGVQQQRVASRFSNFFGALFWKTINLMSRIRIPHNPMTCRLMSRAYVDALLQVGDRVLYLAGVFAWAGFRQESLELVKTPRPPEHKSTYGISRRIFQVADSFSSFSSMPLTAMFILGLVIWLASIASGVLLIIQKIVNPEAVLSGYTSLMFSIWFLSGTIIIGLGLIGLYVAKIFQEVKRRPLFIARRVYRGGINE